MADTKQENVHQRLLAVQHELKAPKQAGGRFGKARSAEQILEAVKPLCHAHGLLLTTGDRLISEEGRTYIQTTAIVTNVDNPEQSITSSANAWEGEVSRGLDAPQVSGAASSYAKKYALQNLFAIDDSKDDPDHQTEPAPAPAPKPQRDPLSSAKVKINDQLELLGYMADVKKKSFITRVLRQSRIETQEQADEVLEALRIEAESTEDN